MRKLEVDSSIGKIVEDNLWSDQGNIIMAADVHVSMLGQINIAKFYLELARNYNLGSIAFEGFESDTVRMLDRDSETLQMQKFFDKYSTERISKVAAAFPVNGRRHGSLIFLLGAPPDKEIYIAPTEKRDGLMDDFSHVALISKAYLLSVGLGEDRFLKMAGVDKPLIIRILPAILHNLLFDRVIERSEEKVKQVIDEVLSSNPSNTREEKAKALYGHWIRETTRPLLNQLQATMEEYRANVGMLGLGIGHTSEFLRLADERELGRAVFIPEGLKVTDKSLEEHQGSSWR